MNQESQGGALIRLRGLYPSLKAALQKVADVILRQPEMAIYASVNEVAAVAGVSEATVMRFCRTLGFRGFQDFKIALAREMVASTSPHLEDLAEGDAPETMVRKVFQTHIAALQDTLEVLVPKAMEAAAQLLIKARQIMVMGVGGSGPIATYAGNRFFCLGLNAHCYTDSYLMMMATALLAPGDVVLVISHSGSTRDPVEAARKARENGAQVICITNNSLSPLSRVSDLVLVTASRETRLHQGMASPLCQITILDCLFTLILLTQPEKTRERLNLVEEVVSRQS